MRCCEAAHLHNYARGRGGRVFFLASHVAPQVWLLAPFSCSVFVPRLLILCPLGRTSVCFALGFVWSLFGVLADFVSWSVVCVLLSYCYELSLLDCLQSVSLVLYVPLSVDFLSRWNFVSGVCFMVRSRALIGTVGAVLLVVMVQRAGFSQVAIACGLDFGSGSCGE